MKSARLTMLTLATAGLIGGAALAADNQQSNPSQQNNTSQQDNSKSSASNQQNQKAPEGFVLFREDVVWVTANEPQNHFLRAHELLNQNKPKEAAGELRVAAAYLDMEASRSQNQSDQRLDQAAQDLRQQAKQIAKEQKGQNKSGQHPLTQAFANANVALADHLQSLAKTELQGNKKVMAGHDLLGAADSLQAAYVWSNQQPQQEASSAISTARQAADQLLGAENYYEPNNADEGAQTAGARMSNNNPSQSQTKSDPSAAIDQLGKAIQSCNCGQSSQSNSSNSSK